MVLQGARPEIKGRGTAGGGSIPTSSSGIGERVGPGAHMVRKLGLWGQL